MIIRLKNINNEFVVSIDGDFFSTNESNILVSNKFTKDDNCDFSCSYFTEDDIKTLENYQNNGGKEVFLEIKGNVEYSSFLGAKIFRIINELKKLGFIVSLEKLDYNIKKIVSIAFKDTGNKAPVISEEKNDFIEELGIFWYEKFLSLKKGINFIKEVTQSLINFIGGTAFYRKKDFWFLFEDCSYKAVGIVSLVSFLVGLIIAFVGAIQLRTFGAEIYVASMVSIGMTRIMAAIMVGIVMAGRTGSSYAATIGTMQVNEEIDALKTLGIKVIDYLVAPRIIVLVLTIPFLTILADFLGILGGGIVGILFLDISSSSYLEYSLNALSLNNIVIGVFHSVVYGVIIACSGCYEGLNAGRNADSVGNATTNAVVSSLVLMVIATGIITVLLEVLGL